MSQGIKHIDVFIGNSNDVAEEREAAITAINNANNFFKVSNTPFRLDEFCWGYEPPQSGRPQDGFNKYVEECQIFLGILGKGWGTPPGTGKYSSGFEEEFMIASKRAISTGVPNLMIYFKDIANLKIDSSESKLLKNLEFRKYVKENEICLYKVYKDVPDFAKELEEDLKKYVISLLNEVTPKSDKNAQANSQQIIKDRVEIQPSDHNDKMGNLEKNKSIITKLLETLPNFSENHLTDDEILINRPFLSRLNLLSSLSLSENFTGELLTAHQANLLYRDRTNLQLTPEELKYLFRTIIGNEIAPGWYWIRDLDKEDITKHLFSYVLDDNDVNVRKGAIGRLNDARIPLKAAGDIWPKILRNIMNDNDQGVRELGYRYIENVGTVDDWPYIEKELKESGTEFSDDAFRLEVMIRINPEFDNAIELILENMTIIPDSILAKLNEIKSKININYLNRAIYHNDDKFAIFAITELIKRGKFDNEKCKNLAKSSSEIIKFICLKHQVDEGVVTDLDVVTQSAPHGPMKSLLNLLGFQEEKLIEKIFMKYSTMKLKEKLNWITIESLMAYKLVCHKDYESLSVEIHEDLDNSHKKLKDRYFNYFKTEFISEIESKLPIDLDKELREKTLSEANLASEKCLRENVNNQNIDSIIDFFRPRYISVALSVLAEKGTKEDNKYGKKYLGHSSHEVQEQALNILSRFGDDSDVKDLLHIAKESVDPIKKKAAQVALAISCDKLETAKSLIKTGESILVSEALIYLQENSIAHTDKLIKPLLLFRNNTIRQDAFVHFARTKSPDELEELLIEYLSGRKYFYNVVYWLDRLIYAPKFLTGHLKFGEID